MSASFSTLRARGPRPSGVPAWSLAAVLALVAACHGDVVAPAGPPTIAVLAGAGQTGLVGFPLNVPPAVVVRRGSGAPMPGVPVVFRVTVGSGSVTGGTGVTDSLGVARAGAWTVGLGANALTVTAPGVAGLADPEVIFSATGVAQQFRIEIRYLQPPEPALQAAVDQAVARWQRVIYASPQRAPSGSPAGAGLCADYPVPADTVATTGNLLVFVNAGTLDGPGGLVGLSGLCVAPPPVDLPTISLIALDTADFPLLDSTGRLGTVVAHEMGHALGFERATFTALRLIAGAAATGGTDPRFLGATAEVQFGTEGGTPGTFAPLENCTGCQVVTLDGHWRKRVFGAELMTGFITLDQESPLSRITAGAMGDLGYFFNLAGAEPYTVPSPAAALRASRRVLRDGVVPLTR